jgi:hypothetical protein
MCRNSLSNGLRYSNAHHQRKQQGENQLPATDDKFPGAFMRLRGIRVNDRQLAALNVVLTVRLRTCKSSQSG